MIEFERTNEKGDKVTAYTHRNYLSQRFNSEIERLQQRNQTWAGVALYGTTILSYWVFSNLSQALHNVPVLNNIVSTKLSMKGRFLIASFGVGFVASALTSVFLVSSFRNTHQNLLKNEVFPAWLQSNRVVNPDRVFFELDDNHHNEPTIWHSSM